MDNDIFARELKCPLNWFVNCNARPSRLHVCAGFCGLAVLGFTKPTNVLEKCRRSVLW